MTNPFTIMLEQAVTNLGRLIEQGFPSPEQVKSYTELISFLQVENNKYASEWVEITEGNFERLIFLATDKKLGEYGFIAGLQTPFPPKEMLSATAKQGFEIWKKSTGSNPIYKTLQTSSIEETFRETIKFLLTD